MPLSRRAFLGRSARAGGLALTLGALPSWLRDAASASEPSRASHADLIERNAWPEHWETRVSALGRSFLTPNEMFFVRSHLPPPDLDASAHRLEVGGSVAHPLSFSLAELKKLPATELTCTLECAGNGRGLMKLANTSGTQWGLGAVGTAKWRGVRLADLLQRAGVAADAKHVWFDAADRGVLPAVPPFLRSIPLEVATKDVILAYEMNGKSLPRLHGGPLRAVVPGWFGMASTKWLTGVRAMPVPSDSHFMSRGYRYAAPPAGGDPAAMPAVETLRVKSLVTRPLDGARVKPGTLRVEGFAWAGPAGTERVDVSFDDGASWRPAAIEASEHRYAWSRWHAQLDVPATDGTTIAILSRATDGAGAVQPRESEPNPGGYGNNAIHRVVVTVDA